MKLIDEKEHLIKDFYLKVIESLNENTCVSCGTPVPEGWMVCYKCENKILNGVRVRERM